MQPEPSEAGENDSNCPLCIDSVGSMDVHKETKRHKYNYTLKMFNDNKKSKVKDRNGIMVGITAPPYQVEYANASGTAKTSLDTDAEGITYVLAVKNASKNPILLMEARLLHPYSVFKVDYDIALIASPLNKGESRLVTVTFRSSGIGYYDVPICLSFHRKGDEFHIIKTVAIKVTNETIVSTTNTTNNHTLTTNETIVEVDEENVASPFTGALWGLMDGIIPSTQFIEPLGYKIPKEYIRIFKNRLKIWDDITDLELLNLNAILTSYPSHVGYGEGFKESHNVFFHSMLWFDEYHAKAKLRMYNMASVPMRLVMDNQVELKVPGLAEKRPSVIRGDVILVRVSFENGTFEKEAYEGLISQVFESSVWIRNFHPYLLQRLRNAEDQQKAKDQRRAKDQRKAEDQKPIMLFDVRFTLKRWPMYVMHMALDYTNKDGNLDVIFPEEKAPMGPLVPNNNYPFFNSNIGQNAEQMVAVHNIVKGSSRPSPYIVFGPPGTGKTVTIVEAILQIKTLFRSSNILVCAPSNAACDHITQLLMQKCTPRDLLRLNSRTRDGDLVPKDILLYCNNSEATIKLEDITTYRIIVCTLVGATRFASIEGHHFTHVFIDEAGQALEPEALVAVGGILGPASPTHPGGQLVLAGDPKQLGPICGSTDAEVAGLGISLLERLMINCPLYQRGPDGNFNDRYFTKLLDNYRSHPSLLKLPNELFYDGELRAKCGPEILNDPLSSAMIRDAQGPLVFHGVIGQERKEGKSPSFFNQLEIDAVMQYMRVLLDPKFIPAVQQCEIGVISPYIRQVYKLKNSFKSYGWNDVEVGTTETFQGREKRVILISTVRANRNLLDYDRNYKLGFLVNKKRFNVAVTRARSLLIVIGCPHVLEMDNCWRALMAQATQRGAHRGCTPYSHWDNSWTDYVIGKTKGLLEC